MLAFGTRPEAIKLAPLIHALRELPEEFEVKVCVTAQHRQMLDQVLEIFEIVPDFDLNLMKPSQDLSDITSSVLMAMRDTLSTYKPDILLVHGDTTTTLASALAAFYLEIPVGHVEAGLRTYDISSPFPEEVNRQVVSRISTLHFAPTIVAQENLLSEKINNSNISVTGNTVIDSLYWMLNKIQNDDELSQKIMGEFLTLLKFDVKHEKYVLITGHRRENFGEGFIEICYAVQELAVKYPDIHFVYPVHLNPNVQEPVNSILSGISNVHLIPPQNYTNFVMLLKHTIIVLTDSGGIQEEAPSLGKPVLVMRDTTERPEAVSAGTVELVGPHKNRIVEGVSRLLEDSIHYEAMSQAMNPYGDGKASDRIIQILRKFA